MGNINSGQLSCSNLDKPGADRAFPIANQHHLGNINSGQSNCLTMEKN